MHCVNTFLTNLLKTYSQPQRLHERFRHLRYSF